LFFDQSIFFLNYSASSMLAKKSEILSTKSETSSNYQNFKIQKRRFLPLAKGHDFLGEGKFRSLEFGNLDLFRYSNFDIRT